MTQCAYCIHECEHDMGLQDGVTSKPAIGVQFVFYFVIIMVNILGPNFAKTALSKIRYSLNYKPLGFQFFMVMHNRYICGSLQPNTLFA